MRGAMGRTHPGPISPRRCPHGFLMGLQSLQVPWKTMDSTPGGALVGLWPRAPAAQTTLLSRSRPRLAGSLPGRKLAHRRASRLRPRRQRRRRQRAHPALRDEVARSEQGGRGWRSVGVLREAAVPSHAGSTCPATPTQPAGRHHQTMRALNALRHVASAAHQGRQARQADRRQEATHNLSTLRRQILSPGSQALKGRAHRGLRAWSMRRPRQSGPCERLPQRTVGQFGRAPSSALWQGWNFWRAWSQGLTDACCRAPRSCPWKSSGVMP